MGPLFHSPGLLGKPYRCYHTDALSTRVAVPRVRHSRSPAHTGSVLNYAFKRARISWKKVSECKLFELTFVDKYLQEYVKVY